MSKVFFSTKRYGNEEGLSCCFRQHKAESHCALLHGYAIGVELVFCCDSLDDRGWVMDFGGLKPIRQWLHDMFDHTILVAEDDPELSFLVQLQSKNLAKIQVVKGTGCENFAAIIFDYVEQFLESNLQNNLTVKIYSVSVFEHGANIGTCSKTLTAN